VIDGDADGGGERNWDFFCGIHILAAYSHRLPCDKKAQIHSLSITHRVPSSSSADMCASLCHFVFKLSKGIRRNM
jgi:hypothetical protein